MLKVVCIAAGRRINSPLFKQKESELKERCRKAGVSYEGPQKNEDYLLGSVNREEKEKADNFTDIRRKRLRMRISKEYERERKSDDISAGKPFGASLTKMIPENESSMCARCATPSGSAAKSSLPYRKKSSCQTKLASAWEPFRNITG